MTDDEIKKNLCYYDIRNPDCTADEEILAERADVNQKCYCGNCFNGKTLLAEELLKRSIPEVRMLLFAKWLATACTDDYLNIKEGYNLREENFWYVLKLNFFNYKIYPEYVKNGTVEDTELYLELKTKN